MVSGYQWAPLEEGGRQEVGARGTSLGRVVAQHVGVAVAVGLLLVAAFGVADMAPRPLWFTGAALAVGFGSLAIRLIVSEVLETNWPARHDEKLTVLRSRSNDTGTQFLATWLQEAARERRAGDGAQTFTRRIRPLLLELTTDRLVHRHGVDPEQEPDRARALAGERLWTLITEKQTASFAEIEEAVQTIEKL